ncbi:ParB/RepB/Spo0J family partition protein [Azospirillum doebereinerae]|uniref:ParB/RepB/Spo0J family partition protein n=1 Tax=Azospirillum doebereinerae TaxID=92933 RepID=A0A433J166_9PROT|nr:ParB/RepB/Spo0J family partition protein [Azospirillum doebereinerae]RUQ63940.1 ParB/RepB/Spo0J family partition protein [Azospirillum doebereinerae]
MAPRKLERTSSRILDKAAQRGGDALFGLSADFPRLIELDIDRVHTNPDQPRRHFDADQLQELAASIERHGLKQPVLVQDIGDGDYRLVAGERRLRACGLAGRRTIFAIVTDGDPDELALIENIQRVDLDALELARAFSRLIDRHEYTHEALGHVIGRSQAEITRTLSLLRLPSRILEEFETRYRGVSKSILSEIAAVEGADAQLRLWDLVKEGGTVKALREAKREQTPSPRPDRKPPAPPVLPVVRLVEAAQKIARDFSSVDVRDLRDHRGHLSDKEWAELRRLHALLDTLLS